MIGAHLFYSFQQKYSPFHELSFLTTLGLSFHHYFVFFETHVYLEYQQTVSSRDDNLEPILTVKYLFDTISRLLTIFIPPRNYLAI